MIEVGSKKITVRYRSCKRCDIKYLAVDFLNYRLAGYCTWECQIGEPRGLPSYECIAWKDKFPLTTAYKMAERNWKQKSEHK